MSGTYKLAIAHMPIRENDCIVTVLFENDAAQEIYIEKKEVRYKTGDIFVGHVQNIAPASGGAFVNFTGNDTGYLPCNKFSKAVFKNYKSDDKLKAEDELIVTVETEPVKTKQPQLTTEVKFSGRNLVITNGFCGVSYSKKLNGGQRKALQEIMTEIESEYGFIVRTSAADMPKDMLIEQANELIEKMDKIISDGKTRNYGTCLYDAGRMWINKIKQHGIEAFERIITDDDDIYNEICSFITYGMNVKDEKAIKELTCLYDDSMVKLYRIYNFSTLLDKATSEHVWLKSGGFIVIQQTEAFVCIDVNSGKNERKSKDDEFILKLNIEAAIESMRQIRLRQLSGTILIDFLNMKNEEDKNKLISVVKEAAKRDSSNTNVVDITKLGIMEITRKKVHRTILKQIEKLM